MLRTLLSLVLVFPLTLFAQHSLFPRAWQDSLATILRADVPEGGPGGAVGVVYRGEVIYEDYAGLADLDTRRPIGRTTRFNVASNAKQFTALCVLRLVEAGRIQLDDEVREYLPELLPDISDSLLIRHLLTHTSGLRDVYNLWSLRGITWWSATLTNADALALLLRQTELNFPPGSDYLYSNSNYLLLAEIVGRVSGVPFAEYADRLFSDLGMHNTSFAADHTQDIPDLARPYFNFDTWQTYEQLTDLHGDGALFATLPDLLRYERLLSRPDSLPRQLAQVVISSQGLPWPNPGTYGYGVEHGDYRGQPVRYHNGSTGAWKATVLRFPEFDLSVTVVNNSGKFTTYDLARDVADVLLESVLRRDRYIVQPPPPRTIAPPAEPTGIYGATKGFAVRIDRGGGDTLILHRFDRPDVRLEKIDAGLYRESTDTTFFQQFAPDAEGRPAIHFYHPSHAPYSLPRSPEEWQSTGEPPVLTGTRYRNAETDVELNVTTTDGGVQFVLGADTLRTASFAERVWVTPSYTFLVGSGPRPEEIHLFDDRLRWVRFTRQ